MDYKITFKKESKDGVVTHETPAVCLPDILEDFEAFLRGCGFVFSGHLEIVAEEE